MSHLVKSAIHFGCNGENTWQKDFSRLPSRRVVPSAWLDEPGPQWPIDPTVGIVFRPKIGDEIERGQELGTIHARSEDDARTCLARIDAALTLSDDAVETPPLVYGWHGG